MRSYFQRGPGTFSTFRSASRSHSRRGERACCLAKCRLADSVARENRCTKWLRASYRFGPEYLGARLSTVPIVGKLQWKMVARQIIAHAKSLKLRDQVFFYSHVDGIAALCEEMRVAGLPLIHICIDYPEPYQYELVELSDQTLVIPKSVFHELRATYGDKIQRIPQSIHLTTATQRDNGARTELAQLAAVPRPRLGYLGPIFARLNLAMLREILTRNRNWHFVYLGESKELQLPNAHSVAWQPSEELPGFVACFDVGLMPYDFADKKNLHCAPLKLYDYFLAGLPVVATPILALAEVKDLVYLGETTLELSDAIVRALEEPVDSPKRALRMEVARAHSTDALGLRLAEVLKSLEEGSRNHAVISLGINYSQMHDSSACIARNGEVLFAVAEERLSRLKHDARFPFVCD